MKKELWLPVVGEEKSYEISNQGNVRSISRSVDYRPNKKGKKRGSYIGHKKGQPLAQFISVHGYPLIGLCVHNKPRTCSVHRLVAKAFIPNPLDKEQINHLDGNRQNNNVANLEWCTREENMLHAKLSGACKRRDNHQKIQFKDAQDIRLAYKNGTSQLKLAKQYDLTQSHISNIINRRTWTYDSVSLINGKRSLNFVSGKIPTFKSPEQKRQDKIKKNEQAKAWYWRNKAKLAAM